MNKKFRKSLAFKLFILASLSVLIIEFVIFVPSVARWRVNYIENKLVTAHTGALALEKNKKDNDVMQALYTNSIRAVTLYYNADMKMAKSKNNYTDISMTPHVLEVRDEVFLNDESVIDSLLYGLTPFFTIPFQGGVTRVLAHSPLDKDTYIEMYIDQMVFLESIWGYGFNILILSLIIAFFVATILFISLQRLLIFPMRKFVADMEKFEGDPYDPQAIMQPSSREDEFGEAVNKLRKLQKQLLHILRGQRRLASVGEGVGRINHDLRGILTSAMLMSETLENSNDPSVKKTVPRLLKSLETASDFCSDILKYMSDVDPHENWQQVDLTNFLKGCMENWHANNISINYNIPSGMTIMTNQKMLFRVIQNIIGNAVSAGATSINISAFLEKSKRDALKTVFIDIADNGPGIPTDIIHNLFSPFVSSGKQSGTGLGLSIARELCENMNGKLLLANNSNKGATFRLILPQTGILP